MGMVQTKSIAGSYEMKGYVDFYVDRKFTDRIKDLLRDLVYEVLDTVCGSSFQNYETDFETISKDWNGALCRYSFSLEEDAVCQIISATRDEPAEEIFSPDIEDYDEETYNDEISAELATLIQSRYGERDFALADVCVYDMEVVL